MRIRRLYVDQKDVELWTNSLKLHIMIATLAVLYILTAVFALIYNISELLELKVLESFWSLGLFDALACATIAGLYFKSLINRKKAEGIGYALVGSTLGAVYLAVYVTIGVAEFLMERSLVELIRPETLLGLGSALALWVLTNRLFK
ncbi:MAG: hypothetical protein QW065_05405 [Acidilobaceae archaeon]